MLETYITKEHGIHFVDWIFIKALKTYKTKAWGKWIFLKTNYVQFVDSLNIQYIIYAYKEVLKISEHMRYFQDVRCLFLFFFRGGGIYPIVIKEENSFWHWRFKLHGIGISMIIPLRLKAMCKDIGKYLNLFTK